MTKVKIDEWLTHNNLRRLFIWAQSGYTDSELADLMNIHRATFYKWREKYSAIRHAGRGVRRRGFRTTGHP